MSRNQVTKQSKINYQNYLTLNNNCRIIQNGSKPLPHLNPQNILTDNMRQVWLSNQLPSTCIIDLRNMTQKPVFYNRIGFHCWHEYESNPKLIEVAYSSEKDVSNIQWTVLAKIRLELVSGWQHFKLSNSLSKNISFLKITIVQNFAEYEGSNSQGATEHIQQSSYLNQISLGYVEENQESRVQSIANTQIQQRQKTFSDYRKLTSSEKQIKKLNQKVKLLSSQNQVMKLTIDHQNSIIIKLQQALQRLTENVLKLQKTQHNQEKRLKKYQERQNTTQKYVQTSHPRNFKEFFNDQSQITNSLETKHRNSKQRQRQGSRHYSIYEQPFKESQWSKPQSIYHKSNKGKSQENQRSTQSKKRQPILANIEQSENSLSEYEGVQIDEKKYVHRCHKGSKQKEYIPMLSKLQQLIMLRDQKKNKLRSHKKSRMKEKQAIYSEEDQSDD